MKITLLVLVALLLGYAPLALGNGYTYVGDCDTTIESSYDGETIMVTDDIVKESAGDCIIISHASVTIDCQGYRLTGTGINTGWYGVWVLQEDALVQNCEFTEWTTGLYFSASEGVALNNKAFANYNGITAGFNLDELWIEGNKTEDNFQDGILLHAVSDSVVYDNVAHGNACTEDTLGGGGIVLNAVTNSVVVGNQTNANCENGIRLQNESDNNLILGNTSNLNKEGRENRFGYGIAFVAFSSDNDVIENTANRNDVGIVSTDTSNFFDGNRCKKNNIADSSLAGQCK